jgi:hypothetical protein
MHGPPANKDSKMGPLSIAILVFLAAVKTLSPRLASDADARAFPECLCPASAGSPLRMCPSAPFSGSTWRCCGDRTRGHTEAKTCCRMRRMCPRYGLVSPGTLACDGSIRTDSLRTDCCPGHGTGCEVCSRSWLSLILPAKVTTLLLAPEANSFTKSSWRFAHTSGAWQPTSPQQGREVGRRFATSHGANADCRAEGRPSKVSKPE